MERIVKEQVRQLDQMRERLHRKYLEDGSTDELLALSQEMDEMILEYFRVEKEVQQSSVAK